MRANVLRPTIAILVALGLLIAGASVVFGVLPPASGTASTLAAPSTSRIVFEYGVWVGATEANDQARVWRADETFTIGSPAD